MFDLFAYRFGGPTNVTIDGVIYGVRATVEEIHVNEGVVNIGDLTFYGCPRLHTVVLPQSDEWTFINSLRTK